MANAKIQEGCDQFWKPQAVLRPTMRQRMEGMSQLCSPEAIDTCKLSVYIPRHSRDLLELVLSQIAPN